ncbi:hypothetical protein [Anaeromyxobacter oryzae]|uniref:Uncharacterized protein n=1 Tax=Anaeromyxobacter oryzae TaxID=2918170 RepID=A0ABM7WRQ6_9BACT|nr:hypothetical protein [Anaeromyxobacter oryzae]BDG02160.1 hypothetical protein AMOR_11560 [Anaeromyxobacter oryzae]
MSSPNENRRPLFSSLPRRRGLAALPLVALWLGLAVAFVVEVAPLRSPEDRFYELEAQRDFYVRAAAARQRALLAASGSHAPARVARTGHPAVQARTPARASVLETTDSAAGVLAAPLGCRSAQ